MTPVKKSGRWLLTPGVERVSLEPARLGPRLTGPAPGGLCVAELALAGPPEEEKMVAGRGQMREDEWAHGRMAMHAKQPRGGPCLEA
ncbi:hypothetical protein NDU88_002272 [Pleurodeles waltl]|uniref:Uncharacterized protein n=1 Tax=Pleurodeles waltl TaxID=8319 RepID=A0AAV7SAF7_PLEWA|nr:hypothetical protein NDU88_002272 [Pleurodeles waltl]